MRNFKKYPIIIIEYILKFWISNIFEKQKKLQLMFKYWIKIKKKTRNINLNKNSLKRTAEIQTEKENLQSSNKLSHIFHNLTELIDIYTDLKAEIQINNYFEEKKRFEKVSPNALEAQQESYESLIRKLEADLRNHMKVNF